MKKEYRDLLEEISKEYSEKANAEYGKRMSAYMKDKFPYYGLKSEARRYIQKEYYPGIKGINQEEFKEVLKVLWKKEQREFQYFAMDLMYRNKNLIDKNMLALLEELVVTKSWWDTVDSLAANPVGFVFHKHPDLMPEYIEKWMASGNMWLQRTCLLFQLKYKTETDKELLFDLCRKLSEHKDFFIRKAIGWALREYSKTNPKDVKEFIENTTLSNLSVKEGLKVINRIK